MADELHVLNEGVSIPAHTGPALGDYNTNSSINPRLFTTNVTNSNTVTINCYEIHDADRGSMAGTAVGSSLLNRLFPKNTTVASYVKNEGESAGYQVIIETDSNSNGSSDLTMNLNNADYFIVIYADNLYKHHIGKITSYNQYEGTKYKIDFTPKLKENIPFGTNIAIYQGPVAAITSTVAVGYGLLSDGHAAGTSEKEERHDVYADVTKPTFYFYKDLDYNTKYVALKSTTGVGTVSKSVFKTSHRLVRFIGSGTDIIVPNTNHAYYKDKSIYTQSAFLYDGRVVGDEWLGIDPTLSAATKQNTKKKVNSYTGGGASYTFDITDWDNCIRNYDETTGNVPAYIQEITSPIKNQYLGHTYETHLNSSVTKVGNMATAKFTDNERMVEKKIKEYERFEFKEVIAREKLNRKPSAELPGLYTRTNSTTITIKNLDSGQDIKTLLGSSAPFEFLYIGDYYYIPSAISAPAQGEQTITVSQQRLFTDFAFSSASIPTFTSQKAYRTSWSSVTNNFLVTHDIDTYIDGGVIKRNNTSINNTEADIYNLEYMFIGKDINGFTLNIEKGDRINNYTELITIPTSSYYSSGNILDSINSDLVINKSRFIGKIELIDTENNAGGVTTTITGRDNISELLGYPVNKNYVYSNEWVYSTISPYTDGYYTIGSWKTRLADSMNTSTLTRVSGSVSILGGLKKGDILAADLDGKRILNEGSDLTDEDRYIPLGVVSQDYASPHTGDIILMNDVLFNTGHIGLTNDTGKYPVVRLNKKLLAGKSLTNSYRGNDRHTDLYGSADKGIVFFGNGNTLEHTASNSVSLQSLIQDSTNPANFGMEINNIISIDGNGGERTDSPLGFDFSYNLINSLSHHEVVTKTLNASINDTETEFTVGYVSPIVLGKSDTNTGDTFISNLEGLYFVNTNGLDKGGFIHLLDSRNNTNYSGSSFRRMLSEDRLKNNSSQKVYNYFVHFGSSIYRYNALGKGNLKYSSNKKDIVSNVKRDSAYINNFYNDKDGLFNAYAYSTKVAIKRSFASNYFRGRSQSYLREDPICLRGPQPAWGSKFHDYDKYPTEWHTHAFNYSIRFPKFANNGHEIDQGRNGEKLLWDLHDPKTSNLYLFAPGDMLPTSEKRFDDIFEGSHNPENYHLLIKYKPSTTPLGITHERYIGNVVLDNDTDDTYEIRPIQSLTGADHRRFNLLKLKQMTLDWLFNEVDFETYKLDNYGDRGIYWHKDRNAKMHHASEIHVPQSVPDSGYGIIPASVSVAIPTNGTNTTIVGSSLMLSGKQCYTSPYDDTTGQSRLIGVAEINTATTLTNSSWTGGTDTITVSSTSGLEVGMLVSHKATLELAQPTHITEIVDSTTIRISPNSNGSGSFTSKTLVFMPQKISFSSFNSEVEGYTGAIHICNTSSPTNAQTDLNDNSFLHTTGKKPEIGETITHGSSGFDGSHNYNAMEMGATNELQPMYENKYGRINRTLVLRGAHYMHGIDIVVDSTVSIKATITIYSGGIPFYGAGDNTNDLNKPFNALINGMLGTFVVAGAGGANGTYTIKSSGITKNTGNIYLQIECSACTATNGTYNLTGTGTEKITFEAEARASHTTYHRLLHDCNATRTDTSEIAHGTSSGTWRSAPYDGMDLVVMDCVKSQNNTRAISIESEYKKATGFGFGLGKTHRLHNTNVYPYFNIDTDLTNTLGNGNAALKEVIWDCLFAPKIDMNLLGNGYENIHRHAFSSSIADEGIISININLIRDSDSTKDANGDSVYFSDVNFEDYSVKIGHGIEWIHYSPDLTGRFLVNESTGVFHQIISHSISKLTDGLEQSKHQLHIDNYDNFSATAIYNVYTLSDNCITQGRKNYTLYQPSVTNLIDPKTSDYHTGYGIDANDITLTNTDTSLNVAQLIGSLNGDANTVVSNKFGYKEATAKAMYVVAELDGKGSKYLIHRDDSTLFPSAEATGKFHVGFQDNIYLTDGINNIETTLSVSEIPDGSSSTLTKLSFGKTTDLKGSVSVGTTFKIKVPKIKGKGQIDYIKIVQPFNVLNETEDIVNDILEDNEIVYNKSGSTDKYYVAANFTGQSAYTSINSILEYKDMKIDIKGETIKITTNDEAKSFRDIEINEDSDTIKVVSINTGKSLLDNFNEVIVYGDGCKGVARNPRALATKKLKTKTIYDYTITSQKEIDSKALRFLKIYNEVSKAVEVEVANELPLLESGHNIYVHYESEGLLRQPYTVIEVIRQMGRPTKLLLTQFHEDLTGTFANLLSTTSDIQGRLQDKVYANVTIPKVSLQTARLKFVKATINASIATTDATIGFDTTIGFTTRVIT